ncbi:MAG: cellulose synthase family protein [Candidatus Hydrothermarchaeota archaeon]
MDAIDLVAAFYVLTLTLLFIYGMNCFVLLYLHRKGKPPEVRPRDEAYPLVTVQLPVYNEMYVVERLIGAIVALDYPRERLEIQVLDDSTDETSAMALRSVSRYRSMGYDITHIHRHDREGYKAGALANGLRYARGRYIAVFDADFLPAREFLRATIPSFSDPKVGMVQARWGHINEDYSLLTKAQSIGIDGHFQIEQQTRSDMGLFLNFNGTAGVWRRRCIEEAGGWQADTLTEDLDLSYRAQLKGWRLVFLPQVVCPGEVPAQINAFKSQQFRWAKGSIQCGRKLVPRVLRADLPLFKKFEAVVHLTYYSVHPLMVVLLLLSLPLIVYHRDYLLYLKAFSIAAIGPPILYLTSQRELYPGWRSKALYLPMLTIFGVGISLNNSRAVLEGILNVKSTFRRTPKFGIVGRGDGWRDKRYRLGLPKITILELFLGLYALATFFVALRYGNYFMLPFLLLYILGYFYVAGLTIRHSI